MNHPNDAIDCLVIRDPDRGGLVVLVECAPDFVAIETDGDDVFLVDGNAVRHDIGTHGTLREEIDDGAFQACVVRQASTKEQRALDIRGAFARATPAGL